MKPSKTWEGNPATMSFNTGDIEYRAAGTLDELEQSYKLVYKAYVRKGYIESHKSEMRVGIHNMLPDTRTFIAKKDGVVLMTLSIIPDSRFGLPMDEIYNIEMDFLRYHGRKIAELSGLAAHEAVAGKGMAIFLGLARLAYVYGRDKDIDEFCIAINPKYDSFYENSLCFEYLGSEKSYPRVGNSPACAKRVNLHGVQKRLKEKKRRLYRLLFEQDGPFSRIGWRRVILDEAVSHFLHKGLSIKEIRQFYHLPDKEPWC